VFRPRVDRAVVRPRAPGRSSQSAAQRSALSAADCGGRVRQLPVTSLMADTTARHDAVSRLRRARRRRDVVSKRLDSGRITGWAIRPSHWCAAAAQRLPTHATNPNNLFTLVATAITTSRGADHGPLSRPPVRPDLTRGGSAWQTRRSTPRVVFLHVVLPDDLRQICRHFRRTGRTSSRASTGPPLVGERDATVETDHGPSSPASRHQILSRRSTTFTRCFRTSRTFTSGVASSSAAAET